MVEVLEKLIDRFNDTTREYEERRKAQENVDLDKVKANLKNFNIVQFQQDISELAAIRAIEVTWTTNDHNGWHGNAKIRKQDVNGLDTDIREYEQILADVLVDTGRTFKISMEVLTRDPPSGQWDQLLHYRYEPDEETKAEEAHTLKRTPSQRIMLPTEEESQKLLSKKKQKTQESTHEETKIKVRIVRPVYENDGVNQPITITCYNCQGAYDAVSYSEADQARIMRTNPTILNCCGKEECQKIAAPTMSYESWRMRCRREEFQKKKEDHKTQELTEEDVKQEEPARLLRPLYDGVGGPLTTTCGQCQVSYEAARFSELDQAHVSLTQPTILNRCSKEECQKSATATMSFEKWREL